MFPSGIQFMSNPWNLLRNSGAIIAIASGCAGGRVIASQYTITEIGGAGGGFAVALGLNAAGDVVGWADGSLPQHAFVFSDGILTDIGTLGGPYSYGHAINDSGTVAGYSS